MRRGTSLPTIPKTPLSGVGRPNHVDKTLDMHGSDKESTSKGCGMCTLDGSEVYGLRNPHSAQIPQMMMRGGTSPAGGQDDLIFDMFFGNGRFIRTDKVRIMYWALKESISTNCGVCTFPIFGTYGRSHPQLCCKNSPKAVKTGYLLRNAAWTPRWCIQTFIKYKSTSDVSNWVYRR